MINMTDTQPDRAERRHNLERRRSAEQRLPTPPTLNELADMDAHKLLHELQVHRIELEMQNDELRQTRAEAETALQLYTELYDFAPVGYFTLGRNGDIRQVNLAGAALLGLERSKLVGRRLGGILDERNRVAFAVFLEGVFTHLSHEIGDLALTQKDGTPRWVHFKGNADAIGESCRLVATDITLHMRIEHALQENNIELQHARAAADKANRAKSEFLSSMSHELRTPLNAVLGFAQLMAAAKPPPTIAQKMSLDQIQNGGWHLLRLINEILDLAMIESGKISLTLESMSLSAALNDCHAMVEPLAQQRGIQLSFPDFDHDCHVYIHADLTKIKQVLINLLTNAIKYNRADGTVHIDCVVNAENRVRVNIQDTGIGLSPEQLAQLFQPFNRLGKQSSSEEGTGIGLVITKQLIDLMNGSMGVTSQVGVGSEFWVEFDIMSAPNLLHDDHAAHDAPDPEMQRVAGQHTLLCVEDNPANLLLMEQLIALRDNITLLTASDGHQGVQMAYAHQPDVILMDINLPDISGLDALNILRNDPATAHIPILALSANAIAHDQAQGLAAGFFCYLTKPIKLDEFMDALDGALRHAAEQGLANRSVPITEEDRNA